MHTLLAGARSFAKFDSETTSQPIETSDPDLHAYFEQIQKTRSANHARYLQRFEKLRAAMRDTCTRAAVPDVLVVEERNLHFFPLRVTRDCEATQAAVFAALHDYWMKHDVVDTLTIDVSRASRTLIFQIMKDVSVDSVSRGLELWATFPCRITRIEVIEPRYNKGILWIAKRTAELIVSKKVWNKLVFTAPPLDPFGSSPGRSSLPEY